ncbi:tyrosine-protein phosphatase [Shewanella yunxiaonensis]|uniref:Tyrosine-protein phosphatase n=1 Tax=Shewanella yunxiaonensis TaxID=2829809 RepID=A0ABX7YPM3_9GAMM|nr:MULTISPECIES: tyrosine-protein phosphatase [Shewanella]MDF0533598.1 tyrosine-protein phosphatase [Shewanella sp. A32]QUN04652.1 tyrosine-protein phosphatase [Shewanella yunxiaonensis]
MLNSGKTAKLNARKMSLVRMLILRSTFWLIIALASLGLYAGFLRITGNFHTVISGELYRSAQPTLKDIANYQKIYGIKTIINLRGEHKGKLWYDNEIAESQKLNIKHINFGMSDGRDLSDTDAQAIIYLLRHAEKPILIHCRAGADRSGLVAALYEAAIAKNSEEIAEAQLSFRYGHVSVPYISRAYAMDESFEHLEPMLGIYD